MRAAYNRVNSPGAAYVDPAVALPATTVLPRINDVRSPWRIGRGVVLPPVDDKSSTAATEAVPPLLQMEREINDMMLTLSSSYEIGSLRDMNSTLDQLKVQSTAAFYVLFLSLRGPDVLVEIICSPPGGEKSDGPFNSKDLPLWNRRVFYENPQNATNNSRTGPGAAQILADYINVVRSCVEILTNLCITHSGLAWYFVTEHPSLLYYLMEFIASPIGPEAVTLLEHILCYTGPVISIARDAHTEDLIRDSISNPYLLALWCRVLAPLVLEGEVGHPPYHHLDHFLLMPECLIPMRRVQNTVEDNTASLAQYEGFIRGLLSLAEQCRPISAAADEERSIRETLEEIDLESLDEETRADVLRGLSADLRAEVTGLDDVLPEWEEKGPPLMLDMGYLYPAHYTPLRWHAKHQVLSRADCCGSKESLLDRWPPYLQKGMAELPAQDKQKVISRDARREGLCVIGACLSTFYFKRTFEDAKKDGMIECLTKLFPSSFGFSSRHVNSGKIDVEEEPIHFTAATAAPVTKRFSTGAAVNFPCYSSVCFHLPSPTLLRNATTSLAAPSSSAEICRFYEAEASKAVMGLCDENVFHFAGREEGNPPFSSIHKREFLQCIAEYWNIQNMADCRKAAVDVYDMGTPSEQQNLGLACVKEVMTVLINGREDASVEAAAFAVIERFLRCFSPDYSRKRPMRRCLAGTVLSPQDHVGRQLLFHFLVDRLYNARVTERRSENASDPNHSNTSQDGRLFSSQFTSCVPGSLQPLWRTERMSGALAELLIFNFRNLKVLSDCVEVGLCKAQELHEEYCYPIFEERNDSPAAAFSGVRERRPGEPFRVVLMRRLLTLGFFMPFFVRALVLSLTPGLRSSHNFTSLKAKKNEQPNSITTQANDSESIWELYVFFTRARRVTRHAVVSICGEIESSLRREKEEEEARRREESEIEKEREGAEYQQGDVAKKREMEVRWKELKNRRTQNRKIRDEEKRDRIGTILLTTLTNVQCCMSSDSYQLNSLDTLPDEVKAFFDDDDKNILTGLAEMPLPGPPHKHGLPLFDSAINEADGLAALHPLISTVFFAPHQLLYSLLHPLQAEAVNSSYRLCVITSGLLICIREARMGKGGEEGVRRLLRQVQQLIQTSCSSSPCSCCEVSPLIAQLGTRIPPPAPFTCTCQQSNDENCPAQRLYGTCKPTNAALDYVEAHGGCFFKNFFRLLWVWVGHYSVVQKYAETLHFSTEVAFVDYKLMACFLLRELPSYFSPTTPDAAVAASAAASVAAADPFAKK